MKCAAILRWLEDVELPDEAYEPIAVEENCRTYMVPVIGRGGGVKTFDWHGEVDGEGRRVMVQRVVQ